MKIGAFDSGIGGTTIMNEVKKLLPDEEYYYIADSKNCPYGNKSDDELKIIVTKNVEELRKWGAKIIIIACNTATTRCINFLRQTYPNIKFIGTEPAIKLATSTDTKTILVMATPGTIASERTKSLLKENQKPGQNITLLPCPGLADTIEKYLNTDDEQKIDDKLNELLANQAAPDAIVLGCTHYSLIKDHIKSIFPNSKLIDGNLGVAREVKKAVSNLSSLYQK